MTLVKHMSDLHLDVNREPFIDKTPPNAKDIVLLLTGDIAEIDSLNLYVTFLQKVCPLYRVVLLCFGNHEYYNGSLMRAKLKLLEELGSIDNLFIMDRNTIIIDDVRFIGATLWTDLDKGDPLFALAVSDPYQGLNDFKRIRTGTVTAPYLRRFTPRDALSQHITDIGYIRNQINDGNVYRKNVVLTHHAPLLSVIEKGKYGGHRLNPAYGSHLEEFVANGNIDYWFHGHTHYTYETEFFGTKIICNARGYSTRENPDFDVNLIIDI